jgi:hypothetical protein
MDYQGNSKKDKEVNKDKPEKNLDKIVKGDVKVKPKTIGTRFHNIFFGGDFQSAAQYVVAEVFLPALRNLVTESVARGMDKLVYGESAGRRRPTNYSSRISYNNPIYKAGDRPVQNRSYLPGQNPTERWTPGRKAFEDIIVATKEDADNVVERLIDIVDMYEVVSVADLYELLGLPSTHVDNKWGWTHLSSIETRQVREGWRITFPPLEEVA